MKQLRLLPAVLLLFFALETQAQQVAIRKDVVYADGKPYGKLVRSGSAWARDFSFKNLNDEELVSVKPVIYDLGGGHDYVYYELKIKGFETKAEMEDSESFGRILANEMVRNQVLNANALNPEGAESFLAKYPPIISARLKEKEKMAERAGQAFAGSGPEAGAEVPDAVILVPGAKTESKPKPENTPPPAVLAEGININGNNLFRNNRKIGQFKVLDQTEDDKKERIYTIFNAQNRKVATAVFPEMSGNSCTISTSKDAATHNLQISNDGRAIKGIAEWLVQHQYL
ncbi:MAG TPA: hypothetical protein VK927_04345 [Adhaeribacter sp.]|nr:hypothetical protein [Adhaeribacter sp.]